MNRKEIAGIIVERFNSELSTLRNFYQNSGPIAYFMVDDLLPDPLAIKIAKAFPELKDMKRKNSLSERKYVSSQMNKHDPLIEEAIFAFQEPEVISSIKEVVGHSNLYGDPLLFAGGISCMVKNGSLNPHIDYSHDMENKHWRALNLLYYASPDWQVDYGGNLELWPHGMSNAPVTIVSKFNRLVVMATHQHSLHSVSPIKVDKIRCCISNYYFSDKPMHPEQKFHFTSFHGRPEQFIVNIVLRTELFLRYIWRYTIGIKRKVKHFYKQ